MHKESIAVMVDELIKYDLSLDVYFTYGPAASVRSRPVLPRREGQPVFMRGEVGVKDDGQLRPLVAHNTTHIDMPVHFVEGAPDLHEVLNNPAYRVNLPLLARVVDVSAWPDPRHRYENNGIHYRELVTAEMLPPVERKTQGNPLRMTGDVHPILLGHTPPVFILEAIAGDRLAPQAGFVPTEGMLEVIPRRANAKGADAAPARVFLSFYRGRNGRQQLQQLIALITPKYLYG